ncbi:alpha/beta fold hydrolase [Solwaraspora sp. WMMB335]|uniref:alpha/beta fold hydrolase n=1 Tax=Solwaraspora sp. WMMB335 TaxID=3404118 RepID=UPI003B9340E8
MTWAWWIVVAVAALAALWLVLWWRYRRWLAAATRRASEDSYRVETPRGPVQYGLRGSGPVVLHFHGGNVGHNGAFFLEHLVEAGYSVLTPDRPGYLGTPLSNGANPDEQADMAAALLDTLGLERVAVVGISAGGPSAIEFSARHRDRTAALVLLSAISQRTGLSDDQLNSSLGKLVMTPKAQNVAYYLINRAMHLATGLSMRDFVKTETTYDSTTGRRMIDQILGDPDQRRQVLAMSDAMVPALPRFEGVMNDLRVQQELEDLPFDQVTSPALIVGSRHDGDIGYGNSTNAHRRLAGSELVTVDQFGHLIWWGDPEVTQGLQRRVEAFLGQRFAPNAR